MEKTHIYQARIDQDEDKIKDLFWEYLTWANERIEKEYGFQLDIAQLQEEAMADLAKFMPPSGRLVLSAVDQNVVGCVCLKRMHKGMGEIKRLYVQPGHRGKGIGRMMVGRLLEEAKTIGYRMIRLDSTRFMTEAHKLYRSFGFQEIPPYTESEIPPEFHDYWIFMELQVED